MIKFIAVLTFLSVFYSFANAEECPEKHVVCYYGSWSFYRPDAGSFNISNFDASLCTHLIYTFAGLDINSHIYAYDSYLDITLGGYESVINLKEKNSCLKTLLAIGGWNEGSIKYSVMVSSNDTINAFADGVLRFITYYGFDGFDFDWEYPTTRGGIPADKDNFATLLKVLKSKFQPWNLLLTMAVPIDETILQSAYNVDVINEYVDLVHLMAYDYTSSYSAVTGLLAPLSGIEKSVDFWLNNGLNANKLILGLPAYGRTFVLASSSDNSIGAPAIGPGRMGTYTQEEGFLSYYELYMYIEDRVLTPIKNDSNCYGSVGTTWFTFDTPETYKEKCEWAVSKNLGGVMVWSIDTDDFTPLYGTQYPVLKAVHECIYQN